MNKQYFHGEEKIETISVNNGKTKMTRRMKFCSRHGFVDVFAVGGDISWRKTHGKCNTDDSFRNLKQAA